MKIVGCSWLKVNCTKDDVVVDFSSNEKEFPKILVPRLPQHISNVNIE